MSEFLSKLDSYAAEAIGKIPPAESDINKVVANARAEWKEGHSEVVILRNAQDEIDELASNWKDSTGRDIANGYGTDLCHHPDAGNNLYETLRRVLPVHPVGRFYIWTALDDIDNPEIEVKTVAKATMIANLLCELESELN